jgi:ergothioneine biosynthesis protein EgtB
MSPSIRLDDRPDDRQAILDRYRAIRARTETLAAPLSPEDQMLQSMPDASPTKWHRAHTTWFFETFVLIPSLHGYRPASQEYGFLFNSYYEAVGPRHPRPSRGMLSRPGMAEIASYRAHVDEGVGRLAKTIDEAAWRQLAPLLELGLNHEEQHQELILMDIKHALALNPLQPCYAPPGPVARRNAPPMGFIDCPGGLTEIGHDGAGFAFDNEGPRHKVYLEPYRLAGRLVTCGEYLDFIADGGYRRAEFWLSDGWATVQREAWNAPLYWRAEEDGTWSVFTLSGRRALDAAEPVCHVSHYEADAYARWKGCRLPTEAEWEAAAETHAPALRGNLMSSGLYHPRAASSEGLAQMIGDCWEWTQSPYVGYPGFRPEAGAVGEYNGKFMANQIVLRGGACVTPEFHVRLTYRNFFPSAARWAFGGIRLAEDL